MKNHIKLIVFAIILGLFVLGFVFFTVDNLRVHDEQEPIFTFSHKVVDGENYNAKIDIGLGYKIIRFNYKNLPEQIKTGTIFMSENISSYITEETEDLEANNIVKSGEINEGSETEVKLTTFGEKYKTTIMLEGMEEEILAQNINSKLGYSMEYYFEDFEYTGYEDHDKYAWKLLSGDSAATMTIYDISDEDAYKEALENITKKELFEEISGDASPNIQKLYYRAFEENDIKKVNYIYIMWIDDLKLMVDLYMPQEAEEGVGMYMHRMTSTITGIEK